MNILKKIRKDFGYTVDQVASLVHISKERWQELEKNNPEESLSIVRLICCLHGVPFSKYCQDEKLLIKSDEVLERKKSEVIQLIDEKIKKEKLNGNIKIILEQWEESKPLPELQKFYEEMEERTPRKKTTQHRKNIDKSIEMAMDNLKRIDQEMGGVIEKDMEEYIDELRLKPKPYWILRLDIDFPKRSVSTKEICNKYNLSRAAVSNSMNKFFGDLKYKSGQVHYWLLEDLRPLLKLMREEV